MLYYKSAVVGDELISDILPHHSRNENFQNEQDSFFNHMSHRDFEEEDPNGNIPGLYGFIPTMAPDFCKNSPLPPEFPPFDSLRDWNQDVYSHQATPESQESQSEKCHPKGPYNPLKHPKSFLFEQDLQFRERPQANNVSRLEKTILWGNLEEVPRVSKVCAYIISHNKAGEFEP